MEERLLQKSERERETTEHIPTRAHPDSQEAPPPAGGDEGISKSKCKGNKGAEERGGANFAVVAAESKQEGGKEPSGGAVFKDDRLSWLGGMIIDERGSSSNLASIHGLSVALLRSIRCSLREFEIIAVTFAVAVKIRGGK